jgi:subtilisin family serine protease
LSSAGLVAGSLSSPAYSSESAHIAVIDSGLDYQSQELSELIWQNEGEVLGNKVDDDENGYVDDIRGWNFANNHATLLEYDDDAFYSPDIPKFLNIQSRALLGKATLGEKKWAQEALEDPEFIKSISKYLNYAHGTHVAGIMTRGITDARVIDIRIIPGKIIDEEEKLLREEVMSALANKEEVGFIKEFIFKMGLLYMAKLNARPFADIATYLDQQNTLVANASVGMGIVQARRLVTPILTLLTGGKAPSGAVLAIYAAALNRVTNPFNSVVFVTVNFSISRSIGQLFLIKSGIAPSIPW